jgi:glycosyltransferase involved in cell wall biosynthesis
MLSKIKRMKIVIIGSAYPLRGGLAAYNERIARAFQEAGDDVQMVTFKLQYPSFLFPGKSQYSSDPAPEDLFIDVSINSINPFNWWSVGRKIRDMKPDLVICKFWLPFMGPCFGTILRQIRKNKHTKIVSIIDNIIPHEKRIGDRLFARYFVKAVDAFVVMSRSVGEDMKLFVKNQPVVYIPHPIYDNYGPLIPKEEACRKINIPLEQKYIMFFGFIRKYKGLDVLLEAMSDERIRKLGIKLIVAGEYYTDATEYEGIIKKNKIEDLLLLKTDFIPDSEVGLYFGAADMVVQPYKTATQSGISQLAYHYELPMLVTDVGGLPEIVSHGKAGYVVPANNPLVVADAIVDFYENKKADSYKKGVQEGKALYSWSNMIKGIKEL